MSEQLAQLEKKGGGGGEVIELSANYSTPVNTAGYCTATFTMPSGKTFIGAGLKSMTFSHSNGGVRDNITITESNGTITFGATISGNWGSRTITGTITLNVFVS